MLTFLFQTGIAVSVLKLLRIQRIRDYLVGAAALAGRITVHTANVLFGYGLACLAGLAIVSAAFLLGLLARAVGLPGVGNFIIAAAFVVTAVALGIITLALTAITGAAAHAITRARAALAAADTAARSPAPNWEELFAQLRTQFPDQAGLLNLVEKAGKGWLANLFDTTGIRAILALPHTVAFDTVEAVAKAAGKMLHFVTAAALWVAIAGFMAMWLPDSAGGFWVIAIPYGLLILVGIGMYKGDEWCRLHKLPDPWWGGWQLVRWGVRFAVVAVIFGAIYTTIDPPRTFSHWMVGLQTKFQRDEEQSAKNQFGARYDQNIQRVVETGTGYQVEKRWYGGEDRTPVAVRPNELLWKTGEQHRQFPDGLYYAEYHRQTNDLTMTPDPENTIWFPESKVMAAGNIESRQMTLPVNTIVYQNSGGSPVKGTKHYLLVPFRAEVMLANAVFIDGVGVYPTLLRDGPNTYRVWAQLNL